MFVRIIAFTASILAFGAVSFTAVVGSGKVESDKKNFHGTRNVGGSTTMSTDENFADAFTGGISLEGIGKTFCKFVRLPGTCKLECTTSSVAIILENGSVIKPNKNKE